MANKKISALTAATTPDGTELVPIVQGGTTKKATVSQLTGATVSTSPAAEQTVNPPSGGGSGLKLKGPAASGAVIGFTNRTLSFTDEISHAADPYHIAAYFSEFGALWMGTSIIVSQKRWDAGGEIQTVNGVHKDPHLAGGLNGAVEFNMVAFSPDGNGPTIAVEGPSGADALTAPVGVTNGSILAAYDTADVWGGATAYSGGYGKKKFQIMGNGALLWGYDMQDTPFAVADLELFPDRSVGTIPTLLMTRPTAGKLRLTLRGNADSSYLEVGQDSTHAVQIGWVYNATAASAHGTIGTLGNVGWLDIDASLVRLNINSGKDVTIGKNAIATNATAGFPFIPANAGAPTGVPGGQSGFAPMYYDTTNHKLWIYDGGWKGVVVA